MKRFTLLKTMLLLCALIVGSSSVWAKQYKKVTSASELVDGAKYLIVTSAAYSNAADPVVSSQYVTIGEVASNNRKGAVVSISGDIATATIATASGSTAAHEIMLIQSGENWNLFDVANAKYLNGGNSKSSNNYLKTAAAVVTDTGSGKNNGVWSISITDGVADIQNQNKWHIRFNPNLQGSKGSKTYNPIMATYGSSNMSTYQAVSLYKEILEPAAPITSSTWDFSTPIAQTEALNGASFSASEENTLYDTNLLTTIVYSAGSSDAMHADGYLKHNGTTSDANKRYFILEIENNGTLEMFSKATFGTYTIKKAPNASTSWSSATEVATITTTTEVPGVSAVITYDAENPFLFIGLSVKAYTQKIVWTPTTDKITLITTDNMDGWRTFYDATQDYEVDANTKIYVAAKSKTENKVTLTKVDKTKIPHGKAVILKTSAGDHKMVLTKTTDAEPLGDNVLTVTDGSSDVDGYRMGYGDIGGEDKVGFFKYTATAPAAGIVYIDKSNVNVGDLSRGLSISFADDETTGITDVRSNTENVRGDFYDLSGRRVAKPTKGLYIVNGKKVIFNK